MKIHYDKYYSEEGSNYEFKRNDAKFVAFQDVSKNIPLLMLEGDFILVPLKESLIYDEDELATTLICYAMNNCDKDEFYYYGMSGRDCYTAIISDSPLALNKIRD